MGRKLVIATLFLFNLYSFSQNESPFEYRRTESLFPEWEELEHKDIEWGVLKVPEDWDNTNGRFIELAVAILSSKNKDSEKDPVVFIQGGPGGGSINDIWRWLNHPLRIKSDIILIDLRGTGFSKPSLCPDLGDSILKILAKNQKKEEDENDKINAVLDCKVDLIQRGINLSAYNSSSISRDLHSLKSTLSIEKWIVYGVSYGTFVSQRYASLYPQDVSSIILDSPISNISNYFDRNTSNYISSLNKLFKACKDNVSCNKEYPNLEYIYYQTIEELDKKPITVDVAKEVILSGKFTYNAEDFKIAIHQSLYQKKLIEVLPLLIYKFRSGNKDVLGNLVAAFSGALGLDYGTYYCVTCNEVMSQNSSLVFDSIAKNYPNLGGGLSFYRSDYRVCENWNQNMIVDTIKVNWNKIKDIPLLVFSGEFDPITPSENAKEIADLSRNEVLSQMSTFGHGSSFSDIGKKTVNEFVLNPKEIKTNGSNQKNNITFVVDIALIKGVANFAESLNKPDLIFLSPLLVALLVLSIISLMYLFRIIKNFNCLNIHIKLLLTILILASISGIGFLMLLVFSILQTADSNYFIIAFGLPDEYSYIIFLCYASITFFILSVVYFFFNRKRISDKSIYYIVLFSLFLMNLYFYYWDLI